MRGRGATRTRNNKLTNEENIYTGRSRQKKKGLNTHLKNRRLSDCKLQLFEHLGTEWIIREFRREATRQMHWRLGPKGETTREEGRPTLAAGRHFNWGNWVGFVCYSMRSVVLLLLLFNPTSETLLSSLLFSFGFFRSKTRTPATPNAAIIINLLSISICSEFFVSWLGCRRPDQFAFQQPTQPSG